MPSATWIMLPKGTFFATSLRMSEQILETSLSKQGEAMTTDPVCGMKVDEKHPEFQTQFAGKKYFFCSDECRKEFEERPDEYVETAA